MTIMLKTTKSLDIHHDLSEVNGTHIFQQLDDELKTTAQLTISNDDWVDMGSPHVLTLTVEPGDRLNDGSL